MAFAPRPSAGTGFDLKPVKVYRDLRENVELESGLDPGDQVVLNPPTDIHENQKVKIAPPPQQQQNGEQVASDGRADGQK